MASAPIFDALNEPLIAAGVLQQSIEPPSDQFAEQVAEFERGIWLEMQGMQGARMQSGRLKRARASPLRNGTARFLKIDSTIGRARARALEETDIGDAVPAG